MMVRRSTPCRACSNAQKACVHLTEFPYWRRSWLGGSIASVLFRVEPLCNSGPKGNEKYSGIKFCLTQVAFLEERPWGAKKPPVLAPQELFTAHLETPLLLTDETSRFGDEHEQSLQIAAQQVHELEQQQQPPGESVSVYHSYLLCSAWDGG